jgi:oxygen-independent coproporphyrinogen-3 oxidase
MCELEVDIEQIAKAHAADPAPLLACLPGLSRFEADGLAHWDGGRIQVSEKGRPFVRSVAALFDAYLTQDADKPRHSRAV